MGWGRDRLGMTEGAHSRLLVYCQCSVFNLGGEYASQLFIKLYLYILFTDLYIRYFSP